MRALERLKKLGYIARIEGRSFEGGRPPIVWMLTPDGLKSAGLPAKARRRRLDLHALAIVEVYIELLKHSNLGHFEILGFAAEPDCWTVVGGIHVRPDFRVDIERDGKSVHLWLEIDMATEGNKQVTGKLEIYRDAYQRADIEQWPVFPIVVWVAIDEERVNELKWLIRQLPPADQRLFKVTTASRLIHSLSGDPQ